MDVGACFIDVVLPLKLPAYYTYRVPFDKLDEVFVGQRVVVQFGQRKMYTAIVRRIHNQPPQAGKAKYILGILDARPILTELQLQFWEWIADYYMCSVGNVMMVALPSIFRLTSEETFSIHPNFDGDTSDCSDLEQSVLKHVLAQEKVTFRELTKHTGERNLFLTIKAMIAKKIICPQEELSDRYTPKKELHLALSEDILRKGELQKLFEQLESSARTEKQLHILLRFLEIKAQRQKDFIRKHDLIKDKNLSSSALNTLVKKGVFKQEAKIVNRLQHYSSQVSVDTIKLNAEQSLAFAGIREQWEKHQTVLLHGVTGSGKTEIYIKLIDSVIREGKQVLYLLPEIALTSQIINRLRFYFGSKVGVYHSRYTEQERGETWSRVLDKERQDAYPVILGARSAVFLPFTNLGLVIIDEEHDTSYKQQDPSPHYHARDIAIYLSASQNAKVLLGSATPSLETYFNANFTKKYGMVSLKKRYGGVKLPEILCADLKEASRKKEMKSFFSPLLLNSMRTALENKEQVILFQNRRGFSLRLECDHCHQVPHCVNCDVSLTYHKTAHTLRCHYCGYSIPPPDECPVCHRPALKTKGFGTEKIEEELEVFFPHASIGRMDLDSTRKKNAYVQIIQDFEDQKIDILVGTQMIAKGLDFDNVGVVGILSADNLINFPDFRAFERSFQQMTQVSGRAGRKYKQGLVIIQTFNPWHQAIRNVMDHDFLAMYESQIRERQLFRYPPFSRMIRIRLRHVDLAYLNPAATFLATALREVFGKNLLGPEQPYIGRVRNFYIEEILLKIERGSSLATAKKQIQEIITQFERQPSFRQTRVDIDVDPL